MSRTVVLWCLVSSVLVLLPGGTWIATRTHDDRSAAALVLVPTVPPTERTDLVQGFERSGSIGTFVEYLAARSTRARSGHPDARVAVRAVPDTRVLSVSVTGGARPDLVLDDVVRSGLQGQTALGELWELKVLDGPSSPAPAGPSDLVLWAAVLLIATAVALATGVALAARRGPPAQAPRFEVVGAGDRVAHA